MEQQHAYNEKGDAISASFVVTVLCSETNLFGAKLKMKKIISFFSFIILTSGIVMTDSFAGVET